MNKENQATKKADAPAEARRFWHSGTGIVHSNPDCTSARRTKWELQELEPGQLPTMTVSCKRCLNQAATGEGAENDSNSTYCEDCGCRITAGRCRHGVSAPWLVVDQNSDFKHKNQAATGYAVTSRIWHKATAAIAAVEGGK